MDDYTPYVSVRHRRKEKMAQLMGSRGILAKSQKVDDASDDDNLVGAIKKFSAGPRAQVSLIEQAQQVRRTPFSSSSLSLSRRCLCHALLLLRCSWTS